MSMSNGTTTMPTATSNITITTTINNNNDKNRDERYTESTPSGDERAVITTANVDDGGENRRDRER
jgi:hypothetical protein